MATVFEPIRPVPPITTIFMAYPPVSMGTSPLFGVADRAWLPLVPAAVVASDQEFTFIQTEMSPRRQLTSDHRCVGKGSHPVDPRY